MSCHTCNDYLISVHNFMRFFGGGIEISFPLSAVSTVLSALSMDVVPDVVRGQNGKPRTRENEPKTGLL